MLISLLRRKHLSELRSHLTVNSQATVALVHVLGTRGLVGCSRLGDLLTGMRENLALHQPLPVQETTLCMVAELAK
jgi:hypothetical protein